MKKLYQFSLFIFCCLLNYNLYSAQSTYLKPEFSSQSPRFVTWNMSSFQITPFFTKSNINSTQNINPQIFDGTSKLTSKFGSMNISSTFKSQNLDLAFIQNINKNFCLSLSST